MHISVQTEGPITGDWEGGGGGRRKICFNKKMGFKPWTHTTGK